MRVFIDCTQTLQSQHRTGIQRVVRNVVAHCGAAGEELGLEALPTVFHDGELWRVQSQAEPSRREWFGSVSGSPDRMRNALAVRFPEVYCKVQGAVPQALKAHVRKWFSRRKLTRYRPEPLTPQAGDVLLFLDASWQDSFLEEVRTLREAGVLVGWNFYDLIPVLHPEFCNQNHVDTFQTWIDKIAPFLDFATAISEDVRASLVSHVDVPRARTASFRLGADPPGEGTRATAGSDLSEFFAGAPGGVYLTVATIEPRKNHVFLLDALEEVWRRGGEARLCLVGKVGWKCGSIVRRIQTHPEFGKRLRWFDSLDDGELEYCYQNSRALLFASRAEGFGLPLVEALQQGLPVLASDLPVFHEVGNEFVRYFSADDAVQLAEMICEVEQVGTVSETRPLTEFRWPTWRESTKELLSAIVRLAAELSGDRVSARG